MNCDGEDKNELKDAPIEEIKQGVNKKGGVNGNNNQKCLLDYRWAICY